MDFGRDAALRNFAGNVWNVWSYATTRWPREGERGDRGERGKLYRTAYKILFVEKNQ